MALLILFMVVHGRMSTVATTSLQPTEKEDLSFPSS